MVLAIGVGAWGVLPLVVPLFTFVAARLGALAFAGGGRSTSSDRAVAGVVLAFATTVLAVRALSVAHAVAAGPLLTALVVVAVGVAVARRDARFALPSYRPSVAARCVLVVAAVGIVLALVAARWLPVWQWDSLGYHLPFVHFTLAARSVDGVPRELPYIGTYPHDVELFFVALRACLPDDRLVDLGQLPFGVAGAIVTAAIARRWGASRDRAVVAGAAWLLVPAVFLQLPTDYVDVATASLLLAAVYFVLAPPSVRTVALAGVALGLFVGSKPSAPLPALVLSIALAVRALRGRAAAGLPFALVALLLLGTESYVANVAHHGNPVWPVRLDLGPVHLPGEYPVSELLAAGANAPRLHGPLATRMIRSLLSLTSLPVFDMRVGGFGPVVVCAVPLALTWLVIDGGGLAWAVVAAALVSPDPAIARYVLAFPALVLAAAAATLPRLPAVAGLAVAAALAWELVYAEPGLAGEGPPLWAYASMTDEERAVAVGADGPPTAIAAARRLIQPGEAFAFDENMDLCDEAWDLAESYRVLFLPSSLSVPAVGRALDDARVRVLVAGEGSPAATWASEHPLQFARLSALSSCRHGTCSLYARR